MACNHAVLSASVDGELDPSATVALTKHLEQCQACRDELSALRALQDQLAQSAPRLVAPSHLRYRIQQDLDARKAAAKASPPRRHWARLPDWLSVGLAGSGSIALVTAMALYLAVPTAATLTDREIVASHYRSLLASHLADVASSDHHTVKPWFTGKLDYAPVVEDFAADGFALIGGRLDYIDQRTVAALAYRHGNHLINVFMWPEKLPQQQSLATMQGYHVLRWSDDGMTFSAVSDMSEDELLRLRALFARHGAS